MFNILKCLFGFHDLREISRQPSKQIATADYVKSICIRKSCKHLSDDLDYSHDPAPVQIKDGPTTEWYAVVVFFTIVLIALITIAE